MQTVQNTLGLTILSNIEAVLKSLNPGLSVLFVVCALIVAL